MELNQNLHDLSRVNLIRSYRKYDATQMPFPLHDSALKKCIHVDIMISKYSMAYSFLPAQYTVHTVYSFVEFFDFTFYILHFEQLAWLCLWSVYIRQKFEFPSNRPIQKFCMALT